MGTNSYCTSASTTSAVSKNESKVRVLSPEKMSLERKHVDFEVFSRLIFQTYIVGKLSSIKFLSQWDNHTMPGSTMDVKIRKWTLEILLIILWSFPPFYFPNCFWSATNWQTNPINTKVPRVIIYIPFRSVAKVQVNRIYVSNLSYIYTGLAK